MSKHPDSAFGLQKLGRLWMPVCTTGQAWPQHATRSEKLAKGMIDDVNEMLGWSSAEAATAFFKQHKPKRVIV